MSMKSGGADSMGKSENAPQFQRGAAAPRNVALREFQSIGPGPGDFVGYFEPTQHLRWRGGVLEQAFRAPVYIEGFERSSAVEWRPVPTVGADAIISHAEEAA